MPNKIGKKSDKPGFFKEYNIRGIYMGDNSYGSYSQWNDAKYKEQIAQAIAVRKKWPDQIVFFQAGNEPPLDAGDVAFHQRFVGGVLAGDAGYRVIGPNKAFNLLGVNPAEMQFYIDKCGKTTDVLNWHTYAQPPSTGLAEARYWSSRAEGKMRKPGPADVMFTESDAWNTGDSQFNYLMERALTFLPEPRIIANFQYCMEKRFEGGTYYFGVLQPDGEFSANYNGYWVRRNLRGRMLQAKLAGPEGRTDLRHLKHFARRQDGHDGRLFRRSGLEGEGSSRDSEGRRRRCPFPGAVDADSFACNLERTQGVRGGCHLGAWTGSSPTGALPSGSLVLDETKPAAHFNTICPQFFGTTCSSKTASSPQAGLLVVPDGAQPGAVAFGQAVGRAHVAPVDDVRLGRETEGGQRHGRFDDVALPVRPDLHRDLRVAHHLDVVHHVLCDHAGREGLRPFSADTLR